MPSEPVGDLAGNIRALADATAVAIVSLDREPRERDCVGCSSRASASTRQTFASQVGARFGPTIQARKTSWSARPDTTIRGVMR